MMWASRKLSTNPAFPSADYASPPPPASSTQRLRRTGTNIPTFVIPPPPPSSTPPSAPPPSSTLPPPSRHHHNHRSRRRSRRAKNLRARRRNIATSSVDEDQRRGTTTITGRRDGWIEKSLDEQKGSDGAADTTPGIPPPWWKTEDRKRGYNRYAALSSTKEDAGFQSQEHGSSGYGVCVGVGGGLLTVQQGLRNKKKCEKSDEEGLRRIVLLEQDSGINIDHDAPNPSNNKEKEQGNLADADGKEGWRMNMAPPRLDDFTFSFPSPLTETRTIPATTGMATTRKSKTVVDPEAAFLPDQPTLSGNKRYYDGNKAVVVLAPPFSFVAFLLDLRRRNDGGGKELAEQILFSSLAGNEEEIIRYFLDKASLYQTSRPIPTPLELPRPCCIPLSPELVAPAARKLMTMQRLIPTRLPANSVGNTPPSMMIKEESKGEEKASACYGPSSAARWNDFWALTAFMRGGRPDQGARSRMWKISDDDDRSSSSTALTALIGGSERRGSEPIKISRESPLQGLGGDCGHRDDEVTKPKVAGLDEEEVGWLEYIIIPRRFDFGQGQGVVGNGNGKVEIPVVTRADGDGNEQEGKRRGGGEDLFVGHVDEEEEYEEKGLLVELSLDIEIENGRDGDELESESEMGGSWGWEVINRVEAHD